MEAYHHGPISRLSDWLNAGSLNEVMLSRNARNEYEVYLVTGKAPYQRFTGLALLDAIEKALGRSA